MANIKLILCLCLIYLQLTLVVSQISWENCDENSGIQLVNVTITPYPIVIPGPVSIAVAIHTNQPIVSPVKADLSVARKTFLANVPLPCIDNLGSCSYDDLCTMLQSNCPLKEGDHILTFPINIYADSWALVGNYKGEVNIKTAEGHTGCVRVNNVHVQSKS